MCISSKQHILSLSLSLSCCKLQQTPPRAVSALQPCTVRLLRPFRNIPLAACSNSSPFSLLRSPVSSLHHVSS
uniref:Uncharacterized protein n=1 Tax=Arundo donax TaxID=35708 RepID=A0A0A8ZKV4_ARUDO